MKTSLEKRETENTGYNFLLANEIKSDRGHTSSDTSS